MTLINAFTTAVIVLEFCNIFLLAMLLVTPAPKHPVVKALIVSCLLRSVLDIIPPIVHKVIPGELEGTITTSHSAVTSFCIANSILLGYATVVKAAFAINFTLPFLWLALIQVRPKCSADDHPYLTKRTVSILCAAPFAWALPVLITPICSIVRNRPANVTYNITSCYFDDPSFTIVCLIFTLIPPAIAVVITAVLWCVIWRFSDTMLEHSGWLFVRTKRFARFGALVFVTLVSALLWAVVLSQWIYLHKHWPSAWLTDSTWVNSTRASVIWEAITPMLFFAIFAAQQEVYETWIGWLSYVIPLPRWKHGRWAGDSLHLSQHATSTPSFPRSDMRMYTAEQTIAAQLPQPRLAPPGKILTGPLLNPSIRRSSYNGRRKGHSRNMTAFDGLTPPPRRALGGTYATEESRTSRYRLPVLKGQPLTTFGSQFSAGSRGFVGSYDDIYSAEEGVPSSSEEILARLPYELSRPETAGSSGTFGHLPTARR